MLRQLVQKSDCIVTHSKVSSQILSNQYNARIQDKIAYIPHPNYIGVYGPSIPKKSTNVADAPLRLIFIGAIRPYKNIELLIEVVNSLQSENLQLNIYGKIHTPGYEDNLRRLCNGNSNIHLHPHFVADELLNIYLSHNDVLVCPYDKESSLNSGTVILAFSNRTTVICPNIGTISDFDESPNILSYDYKDHESHRTALTAVIGKAIRLKKADPDVFIRMGENMYQQMRSEYSKEAVVIKFSDVYNSIV